MRRPVTLTLHTRIVTRPLALVALVVTAALTLSACMITNPYQTVKPYEPSDGVGIQIGNVAAIGLVVVAPSKGAAGVLTGSLLNQGVDPVEVTFLTADQAQAGTTDGPTISLQGREQQTISGVQFPSVPVPPGALMELVLKTRAGQQNGQIPVLTPDLYYSTITARPAATATTSGTASATNAPATSGTPGAASTQTSGTSAATSGTATTSPTTRPTTSATTGG